MVAFGKKLAAAAAEAPFDAAHYLDYESLKALLYDLQPLHLRAPVAENALSLAVAPATNAAAMPLAPLAEGETRTRGHEVFLGATYGQGTQVRCRAIPVSSIAGKNV